MADIQPLHTLRYDLGSIGSLDAVAAPPYDVIDATLRAELVAKSPFNVVEIDLPQAEGGDDPYLHAQTTFEAWRQQGVIAHEREPAIWPIEQEFTDSYGTRHVRGAFLCRVRVEDYGAGRIRPHERTQPGPKEDRLRLTRATRANLSPIFSLYPGEPVDLPTDGAPFGEYHEGGATTRIWRCADPDLIASVQAALADAELLIADGHHRYETARVYADEVGGEGEHRYTLMCLCAMSDPGLTVLPTHRLLTDLTDEKREALRATVEREFDVEPVERDDLEPPAGGERLAIGYYDRHHRRPLRLTLKDPAIADRVLADKPAAYRRLDTALLEALILRDTLGMTEDDVARQNGLTYAKRLDHAIEAVESGSVEAAFFMSATPVELVQDVAETGESMPPKSTYFYPKIPTGLVFNPLE
ncbi:MAG TPA: DUF1015 domain-containing protein [Thermoleophilaceae bacterium]